jgi:hypothetical protein
MTQNLAQMNVQNLVEQFADLGVQQSQAELYGDRAKENKLIRKMWDISNELKSRAGDQRSALLELYSHPNAQVRVMAAKETLAVAPVVARDMLQAIKDSKEQPQALEAGMCLWTLDEGIFKPT